MSKFFVALISLVLLGQILSSFFYSSNIITQNSKLAENQNQYNSLKLEVEFLEQQLASFNSINNISQKSVDKNFQFIKSVLKP